MIIEKKVDNMDDKPIIIKKKNVPQSENKNLPTLFNTSLFIGSKGTGKSYKLTQMLKLYEASKIKDDDGVEYKMRTILICPTANSGANEVYKILSSLDPKDIYLDYTDEILSAVMDDIKQKHSEYDRFLNYKKVYNKFAKIKDVQKLDDDELMILEEHDFMEPKEVYGDIKPIITWIIFDDLIGTGAYSRNSKSLISNLCIKHRHIKTNLIFTTQSHRQINNTIRVNVDIYCIFKSSSHNEILNKVYEDVNGFVKLNDFVEMYDHATENKNDCLTIINNSMDKKGVRFYKNFNIELLIK